MAASSVPLHHVGGCFSYPRREREYHHGRGWSPTPRASYPLRPINASVETPFPLFQPPPLQQSPSQLEPADPDFYKIGYVRSMRAYGIEFKDGPDGFGVYASKDVEPLRRARVIMEIPLELMLTIRQKQPWMFFPDIVPIGHPIFDIINSTNPETDWDLRLACLLLYAFDRDDNFWQLYGDFLPSADECTSLLLATEDDLSELQDPGLASTMRKQQQRALEFWEKNWHSGVPLKIKRLARDAERFIWAVSIAQSRCINMQVRIGALVQDANMLIPYADMLNHSFQPNCFLHWRFKDRMVEVMINAGQRIKKGDEMTINYLSGQQNHMLMQRYGFSSAVNPWDLIPFSGNAHIHLDSFLSVFNISGLPEEYYHNSQLADNGDNFVDGAVIATARTLPTWSDGDVPPIPSIERKAVKELQEECQQMLAQFPTTSEQDQKFLDSLPEARTLETVIKYRLHRKLFIEKVIQALDIYQERILF
ncbi:PREDICTED: protein PLASTID TRANSCRIPTIONALLY ACTIVE 14 isoform X1 [Theobroma cacao]|uniref:Protein PLASTID TRANSCRIPTIONALLY ACTIVE 14 isoform X1 n=2 Tax=Theobroma cacao TaxID=3641 RepID=A0AB32UQU0_THECC|nr:PREDICTED: protein PLASTID TRANSCRIPTIONALLY ACTIVE 14 isoform X1 [Theobroma cacao]EOY31296.1 Plastid transcriptionally active 14 isoform 1 [Theobroma cacao]